MLLEPTILKLDSLSVYKCCELVATGRLFGTLVLGLMAQAGYSETRQAFKLHSLTKTRGTHTLRHDPQVENIHHCFQTLLKCA